MGEKVTPRSMLVSLDTGMFEPDDLDAAVEVALCIPVASHGGAIDAPAGCPAGLGPACR
jgi:hypothetical protein